MRRTTLLIALGLVAASANAQLYTTVPTGYDNLSALGNGLNTFIRDSGNPRSGQLLIGPSQLTALVGRNITGITFRMYNGAAGTFPPTDATWADYTINMGAGVGPALGTATFASNFSGTPTTVRTGALTIPAGTFIRNQAAGGSIPNAWGFEMAFQTPYFYSGGSLTIEIRHSGSNVVNSASDFLDALATTTAGYGTDFSSFTATGNTATTGAAAAFTISRLTSSPVPEPASMIALSLGTAALLRRRRK